MTRRPLPTRRALAAVLLLVAVALALGGLAGCRGESHAEGEVWFCPMHPDYVADRPGSCPICHMDLVRREPAASAAAPADAERKVLFYRNPMDPSVTSPVPAKDEMGMDYLPVYSDEAAGAAAGGLAPVDLGEAGRRMSGVVVAEARAGALARVVRTVGSVVADERRDPSPRGALLGLGRGAARRLRRPLRAPPASRSPRSTRPSWSPRSRSSCSPARRGNGSSPRAIPEVRRGGQELVDAARRRLEVFGLPEEFLAELEREGKPRRDRAARGADLRLRGEQGRAAGPAGRARTGGRHPLRSLAHLGRGQRLRGRRRAGAPRADRPAHARLRARLGARGARRLHLPRPRPGDPHAARALRRRQPRPLLAARHVRRRRARPRARSRGS